MISPQRIEVEGKRFVLLEESEFDRLCREAGTAATLSDDDLPELPKPDSRGRVPAVEYSRISLARDLIRQRKGLGLSQSKLAELAGIRQETLSRLETGKHSASAKTVDKIVDAIEAAQKRRRPCARKARS